MTKAEIRSLYKAKRAALTSDQVAALSQQLADCFFADSQVRAALNVPGAVLHTFLPIRRQHEVDTWPIIRRIWAEWPDVSVLSSVTDDHTHTLRSFVLVSDTTLIENRWGIPEPTSPVFPTEQVPTLVLVPLLAFDQQGHRVGYGGGYYDRFLSQLPDQTLKIGLSLLAPLSCLIPVEPTDVPLTACAEPERITWWPFLQ